VIDLADPTSPRIREREYARRERGVASANQCVYVADNLSGLQILPAHCDLVSALAEDGTTASAGILAASPNPSRGRVSYRLRLSAGTMVALDTYDLAGRVVRRLFEGHLASGEHLLAWDGRDDSGRLVPAGVYLSRLSTESGTATRRLILLQ
jgi:hypothetical protein